MRELTLPWVHEQEIPIDADVYFGSVLERDGNVFDQVSNQMNRTLYNHGYNTWYTKHYVHVGRERLFRYKTVKDVLMTVNVTTRRKNWFSKKKKFIRIELILKNK